MKNKLIGERSAEEMTLQQCKDQVAKGKGYSDWNTFVLNEIHNYAITAFWGFLDEAAEMYASQFKAKEDSLPEETSDRIKELEAKLDFYRTETSKLREYLETNGIGKPNQKLFDALYDHIRELESKEDNKAFGEQSKVVCFCGSTRFAVHFMVERWKLEKQGIITLGINILPDGYFDGENHHGAEQEGVKDVLDNLHLRKIDLSDEVVILNVGGYIGESTQRELEYALSIGKPVKYYEPI